MKYFNYTLLVLLLAASGCQHLDCPAFDETERTNWLHQEEGTTLVFEQESGLATVTFAVKQIKVSKAYREKSEGLARPRSCEANASIELHISDASVVDTKSSSLTIESSFFEEREQGRQLSYQLGDFKGSFQTFPIISMPHTETTPSMERDSIASTLILGGKTYSNVLIQGRNPMDTGNYQIHKVYLAPGYGIIGFVSRGKRYYRK